MMAWEENAARTCGADSNTNLHVLNNDVIIDASMPNIIRGCGIGQMWNKDDKLKEVKCVIPDRFYAGIYNAIVENCQELYDTTTGHISNLGLLAQKAEEYGSHNKTKETVNVTDAAGNKSFEHAVETGNIWSMCQVKDIPIQDWVKLAVSRAKATGAKAVFWLDSARAHDANLISLVKKYLANHDTTDCDIEFLKPADACTLACDRAREGLDTINCTSNVLRDYLTDLFPILELSNLAATQYESDEDQNRQQDYPDYCDDVQIEDDKICQLDGAADPVTCNLCQQSFEGKNKGFKLISHKINNHYKDHFRRVCDEKGADGYFHCVEENCSAKHKQKADLYRHLASVHKYLDRFSNSSATRSLSVQVSQAQVPGPEQIPDLSHQEQEREEANERGAQSLTPTSSATEDCQQTLPVSCVFAGVGSSSAADTDTNQGKMIHLSSLLFNLHLFRVSASFGGEI